MCIVRGCGEWRGFEPGSRRAAALSAALCAIAIAVTSCGGGGSSGGSSPSTPPVVQATLVSFPTGAVPPGTTSSGSNSAILVKIADGSNGATITNASVIFNGLRLSYNPTQQIYYGEINVAPGDAVSLSASVSGNTYTASANQVSAYPTITAPSSGATWSTQASNLIAWTGVAPSASARWAVGIIDSSGNLKWPASGFQAVAAGAAQSVEVPAAQLTAGSDDVLVGLSTEVGISGTTSPSGLVTIGMTYVPITITTAPPSPSVVSISVTPATADIALAGILQLTATATYSDNSTRDVTAQASWTSTSSGTVSVGPGPGVVIGAAYGTATISAAIGTVSGSATVTVFQPTPSPVPPLAQSVAFQIDSVHSGSGTLVAPMVFPAAPAWTATLSGATSYPLVAGGLVFAAASAGTGLNAGANLYALNEQTGAIVWGPVNVIDAFGGSAIAYDNGSIFFVNGTGVVQSYNAATGVLIWSQKIQSQVSSPPTAANGVLYVANASSSANGTLYAFDESNGNVLWTQQVLIGQNSSPAVATDGVYVTYPCQVYKFDPISGATLWHYNNGCIGAFSGAPVVANGYVFARDPSSTSNEIFLAANGSLVEPFPLSSAIPAVFGTTGYFRIQGVGLVAKDVSSPPGAPPTLVDLWTFAGDGNLATPAIVIDQTVFIASTSGNVYGLSATTGAQLWSGNAGAAIAVTNENDFIHPISGLGAGDGYLIVPAGNGLTAWRLK